MAKVMKAHAPFGKRIGRIAAGLLTALVVLTAAFVGYLTVCNLTGQIAFLGQYAFLRIVSPSMEPLIPTNGYILVKKISPEQVQTGDVIVFVSTDPAIAGHLNTHRVMEIQTDSGNMQYLTKGDNNQSPDAYPVSADRIRGRYVRNIPFLTKIAVLFTNPALFFVLVLIPSVLLVVICGIDVVKKARQVRMEMLVKREVAALRKASDFSTDGTLSSTQAENLPLVQQQQRFENLNTDHEPSQEE